jgi:hypothetical protein
VRSAVEILPPTDLPEPLFGGVLGFEDLRIFDWQGALWCVACCRELTPEGWCEQILARIDASGPGPHRLVDWRVMTPEGPRLHQKNWMPRVDGDELKFIYLSDPTRIVDVRGATLQETSPVIAATTFRGGTQAIAFDGGFLTLLHEVHWRPALNRRFYQHRFVWFNRAMTIRRVSRPFYFDKKGIEFAAGLAWHPDGKRMLLSYSVTDSEAWIATIDAEEIRRLLEDVERLSAGVRETARASAPDAPPPPIEDVAPIAEPAVVAPALAEATGAVDESEAPVAVAGFFDRLAPFLGGNLSPLERRLQSRAFDARIAPMLRPSESASLPQIHCFYEVLSEDARHESLIAATTSMRQVGHPVRVWSYEPSKLDFLRRQGVDVRSAEDVVPRALF